jgi:hypothetical protein
MAQEPDAEIELDTGADASRTVGEFQRSCPPLTVRSITPVARWWPRRSLSRGPAEITEVGDALGPPAPKDPWEERNVCSH